MSQEQSTNNTAFSDSIHIGPHLEEEIRDLVEEIAMEEAIKVIEYNYRAPGIAIGDGFKDQPLKEQARYMHRLASSMNHAAKLLQDERNELLDEVKLAREQVSNAEKNLDIQKTVNINVLNQMNMKTQEDAIRTGHLQGRIKILETIVKAAGLEID